MKLLLDLGHTRLKWALANEQQLILDGAIYHEVDDLYDVLEEHLPTLSEEVSQVFLANVAGEQAAENIEQWFADNTQCELIHAKTKASFLDLKCAYAEPERFGIDRWLSLLAVWQEEQAPALVIDCGTTITADLIDAQGQHLGGFILPGLMLSNDTLLDLIDKNDEYQIESPKSTSFNSTSVLAQTTSDAITMGSLFSSVAVIERLVTDCQSLTPHPLRFYLTGGDANALQPLLTTTFQWRPQLVLQGLALVAANQDKS